MPEEVKQAAEEVPQEQAPAEVSPQSVEAKVEEFTFPHKIGDTDYADARSMAEGLKRFQGEHTRARQEAAGFRDKAGQFDYLMGVIKSDPLLVRTFQQRLQMGDTPKEAAQETAKTAQRMDPAYIQRLESLESKSMRQESDSALAEFRAKHQDLTPEEEKAMHGWIAENDERLNDWPDALILQTSYQATVLQGKFAGMYTKGQEDKIAEQDRNKRGQFVGSVAPTSTAKGVQKPGRNAPESKKRNWGLDIWKRNESKAK